MDITAAAGTDLYIDETVTNTDGTVRDITGATGTLRVLDSPTGVQVFSQPATITNGPGGLLTYQLPASTTANFVGQFHVLWWEALLTESNGTQSRLDYGKLTLS